ncbi:hypothetical protein ACRERF_14195, partial [Lacticaseibacillus rhamnosus]
VVTPLKTLMGFSVHLNVQFKFYNLPITFQTPVASLIISCATVFTAKRKKVQTYLAAFQNRLPVVLTRDHFNSHAWKKSRIMNLDNV